MKSVSVHIFSFHPDVVVNVHVHVTAQPKLEKSPSCQPLVLDRSAKSASGGEDIKERGEESHNRNQNQNQRQKSHTGDTDDRCNLKKTS